MAGPPRPIESLPTPERLWELFHYCAVTGVFRFNRPLPKRAIKHRIPRHNKIAGSITPLGYRNLHADSMLHYAHRVAWAMHYGEWPTGQIDHINGNRDDNRIANLRVVTPLENMRNRRLQHKNHTGHQGIRPTKHGTWFASIGIANSLKVLGTFRSKEAAVAARKNAEIELGFHQNHGRK